MSHTIVFICIAILAQVEVDSIADAAGTRDHKPAADDVFDDGHLDRHAVEVNHAPHNVRGFGRRDTLVDSIDVIVQRPARFLHQAYSISFLENNESGSITVINYYKLKLFGYHI